MSKLTTASVLAFERKLDVSDAFFWQTDSQSADSKLSKVKITEKSVRGTISNRLKKAIANDIAKLDAEVEKANLQTVDAAALSAGNDTLVVRWSVKVLPFDGKPNVCNDQDYQVALVDTVQDYISNQGVKDIAKRYATNIANARWLWRNRVGAQSIKIEVKFNNSSLVFDAQKYSLNNFDTNDDSLNQLASCIEKGLMGEEFIILYVEGQAVVGYGQEVYPSQELVLDTGRTKSKVLYQVDSVAGMHSQKISNAIRTIDDWYTDAEFPIAVEPYGAVTTLGKAFRQPKQKQDFYSLFDNWILNGIAPSIEQQHYVIATLIRGGVFGESGK